jgi:hypothetical protein
MKSTEPGKDIATARVDRRIPSWASRLIAELARDRPAVVTREDVAERLAAIGDHRDVEATISELRRLGWFVGLPIQGTWAFIPPGQETVADPYLALRAWRARDPDTAFMLAGTAAAWHLGYLDRAPEGRTSIWLPKDHRLPDGLRPHVSVVHVKWGSDAATQLGPSTEFLLRRHLDIVNWAAGLPAFGPEALVVQLAARPASFRPWADVVAHLGQIVDDCDDDRIAVLMAGQSASTWQRAAYVLHAGGQPTRGIRLVERRPKRSMPKARFEHPEISPADEATALWVPQYHVLDRLIAPLQGLVGKA